MDVDSILLECINKKFVICYYQLYLKGSWFSLVIRFIKVYGKLFIHITDLYVNQHTYINFIY